MKFVIVLCFLAVAYAASVKEKEEAVARSMEVAAPEQARACVGTKEKCVEGDDCSCCGEWDSCDCNNPNEPNVCRCKYAMLYTRVKKMVAC
ncbi:U12-lycotoxin-Ls1d, partial [Stegodyphus mimosarum]